MLVVDPRFQVAAESSDDEEETIRWAYQDAKAALLSEEPNVLACFQRVLTIEGKKGSKTVWGFKALKHLVVASIQAVSPHSKSSLPPDASSAKGALKCFFFNSINLCGFNLRTGSNTHLLTKAALISRWLVAWPNKSRGNVGSGSRFVAWSRTARADSTTAYRPVGLLSAEFERNVGPIYGFTFRKGVATVDTYSLSQRGDGRAILSTLVLYIGATSSVQNDLVAAADRYAKLLEYIGVVSSAVLECALVKIAVLAHDPKATLRLCQVTYNVRKVGKVDLPVQSCTALAHDDMDDLLHIAAE